MQPAWTKHYDAGVPSHLTYPDLTVPDLLAQAVARFPARPAIRFYGRTIRYAELDRLVTAFALGLQELGVGKGGVVGLMLPNLPQTVIGYFGALRAGAIVTAINPLYVEGEVERQVTDSGCEVLLVLDQFFPRVKPLLGRTCLRHVILTGVPDYLPWLKRLLFPLKAGNRRGHPIAEQTHPAVHRLRDQLVHRGERRSVLLSPDDTALLQYTGGTTGVPKGVVLTHRNLVCNTWQCRHWMPSLREGAEVFLAVLPFFHVYGLSACENLAVSVAGTMVILPRFQVSEVLPALARERVTVFPGIPAMYMALNAHHERHRYDLRSVRLCISGAGPLHPSVQEQFESVCQARLVEGYGLTEAGPVTHINPLGVPQGERRRRTIGLPLPDTEVKIMDMETGERELPLGEVGEMAIRGPQVMRGYWKQEEETRAVLRNGWLYTGDLARMDEDGYFYLADRKKEMIKSGGENVYPREVEEVLLRHEKVKDAVVVGLPQGLRGELIKAFVVLREGETATPAEILEHCRKSLAKFKVPKKVEFRNELPTSLVGKVLRRVLIEEERQKQGVPVGDDEDGA